MTWSDCTTGDLILMSGWSLFAKIIKEAAGVPWSHTAILVRGGHVGLDEGALYAWEATGRGVGEVPLKSTGPKDFFTRLTNPGAGDVAVRRLSWPVPHLYALALSKFRSHRLEMLGRPYETNKKEMLNAAFPWLGPILVGATHEDLSTLFCWEATAAAWQAMGVLPPWKPANSYSIVDFLGDKLPLEGFVHLGDLEAMPHPY